METKTKRVRKAKTWAECRNHLHTKKAWVEQGKDYLKYCIELKDGFKDFNSSSNLIKEQSIKAAVIELNRAIKTN